MILNLKVINSEMLKSKERVNLMAKGLAIHLKTDLDFRWVTEMDSLKRREKDWDSPKWKD